MSEVFDVAVVGGGPAGIAAALAAARRGARTLLIERHPILGGMGTAALVNNFCNAYYDGERWIIGGIFAEIRSALIARGALYETLGLEPYHHHTFCAITADLCRKAGVTLWLACRIEEIAFSETSARIETAQGTVTARTVVDASGDAVVAAGAGVTMLPRESGRPLPMPMNYCYLLGPVDREQLRRELPDTILADRNGKEYLYLGPQPRLKEMVKTARERGELTIQRERIAVAYSVPLMDDHISVNFGRVVVNDPTNPAEMAEAEREGMRQVEEGARFFRKYVPGFANANVTEVGLQIGVRESRQIHGRYVLTGEDVLACRQFDDVIAQCCYSVDIHEPGSDKTTMIALPKGQHFDIPLRCLIPAEGPKNLVVAGRSISATQTAMSSFRVSPSVMAIGEAAGVTAALAACGKGNIGAIPAETVQAELRAQGAILA